MNRIDRLTTIVMMLQSRRTLRAQDIAERFGISLRTVYRDIRTLEEAGLPIMGEVGKGYSLMQGYRLSPIMFSPAEASALYVGGKFVDQFTDSSLHTHMTSALAKIRAVLPHERKTYWEQLEATTEIVSDFSESPTAYSYTIIQLQDAIIQRNVLHIQYCSNTAKVVSKRDIEPLGLLFYAHHWHLIAYCRLRQDLRDFRVDCIQTLAKQDIRFPQRADFSLKHYFENSQRLESPISVQVQFPQDIVPSLADKFYYGFVEAIPNDGGSLMTFLVSSLKWIFHWLLGFGASVEVISPLELRQKLATEAQKFLERYRTDTFSEKK